MPRGTAPSIEVIAKHHGESATSCWACGRDRKRPERAHIVPSTLGGSDTDPDNFALLCSGCHLAAPDVRDAEFMWEWIYAQPCETDIVVDAVLKGLAHFPEATPEVFGGALQSLAQDITAHQGFSPATKAWVIEETFHRAAQPVK